MCIRDRLCWLQLLPQSLRCSLVTDLNRSAPRSRLVLRKNPPRHPFPPISIVPAERAEAKVPRSSHPRRTIRRPVLSSYAAFLQNASVWCVLYPGFHPGLVCGAPLGHSEDPPNHLAWQTGRQRDLGRSAPWRRTPHPVARSAKAHPSQSLLSARRPWSRGARTRDAPFEGLSYSAIRRSFRTHRFRVYYTQGFTLGWYAVPRWGTPNTRPTPLRGKLGGSGTLAVARLGGEHHTHSRTARKPILSRAY